MIRQVTAMTFREAGPSDLDLIKACRNSQQGMANSNRKRPLTDSELQGYLINSVIAEVNGWPIGWGQVKPTFETSHMVAPDAQGHGFGAQILAGLMKPDRKYVSFVQPDNAGCLSNCAKVGLDIVDPAEWVVVKRDAR